MPLTQMQIRNYIRAIDINVPFVGGWLRRRAVEALVQDGSPEVTRWLAMEAMFGRKKHILPVVLEVLRQFDNQRSINTLCGAWVTYRQYPRYNHENLAKLIAELGWVASSPISLQVLTALLCKKPEEITGLGAKVVAPLIAACDDKHSVVAEQAKQALFELEHPSARNALCEYLIEHDNSHVMKAALALGLEPKDENKRTLFYFMTGQWDKYEALDFDHRRIRAVYDTADSTMRQRIADRLRASGKPHLLSIAVGGDLRSREGAISEREADLLIEAVISNKDWPKLWELASEVPFIPSVRAVQTLVENRWEPENPDDRAMMQELASILSGAIITSADKVTGIVPVAIRRARVRVPGRVNSVALSPVEPVIAIGTGQGKVVLWNYHEARRVRVLSGFNHSIGRLAFTANGGLVCGERSVTTDETCSVYGWQGEDVFELGNHKGPITSITPVSDSMAIVTGRDRRVVLWDLSERRSVVVREYWDWIRDVCLSPDGTMAAFQHQGINLVTIPELNTVATKGWKQGDVISGATFTPDGKGLIALKSGLKLWTRKGEGFKLQDISFGDGVIDYYYSKMLLMPDRPVIVVTRGDGEINFISWEKHASIGSIHIEGELLTSLNISSDGTMMAVGDSDASMTLWDLRPLELPIIFTRPFSQFTPGDLKIVGAFIEDIGLPDPVRHSLRYMRSIMHHRFRYDVQIDDAPLIQAGDFDIEIE